MKANLHGLNNEQREAFAKINALLGLGPDECTFLFAEESGNGRPSNLILSANPEVSHVTPVLIPTGSIADLRKLAGYDDILPKPAVREEDERHYPGKVTGEDLGILKTQDKSMKPSVSKDLEARIRMAAIAYVMLDPERVRDYVPLINATMFPGTVAAFVTDNLVVATGETFTITSEVPVVVNFGTVTVHPGGSIRVDANCTFNCQEFIQL